MLAFSSCDDLQGSDENSIFSEYSESELIKVLSADDTQGFQFSFLSEEDCTIEVLILSGDSGWLSVDRDSALAGELTTINVAITLNTGSLRSAAIVVSADSGQELIISITQNEVEGSASADGRLVEKIELLDESDNVEVTYTLNYDGEKAIGYIIAENGASQEGSVAFSTQDNSTILAEDIIDGEGNSISEYYNLDAGFIISKNETYNTGEPTQTLDFSYNGSQLASVVDTDQGSSYVIKYTDTYTWTDGNISKIECVNEVSSGMDADATRVTNFTYYTDQDIANVDIVSLAYTGFGEGLLWTGYVGDRNKNLLKTSAEYYGGSDIADSSEQYTYEFDQGYPTLVTIECYDQGTYDRTYKLRVTYQNAE